MNKVIIVADASTSIGSGHIMRCMTIAKNLIKHNCQVTFLMSDLPGNLIEHVISQGFSHCSAYKEADLYIIDRYDIGIEEEKQIRKFAKSIMVIDDLANRPHDCDLLLDQNLCHHYETRYDHLVPKHCKKLLGPQNLIIRDEFLESRRHRSFDKLERLLLFMGGSDPTNETLKVLEALTNLSYQHVDVVVGNGNVYHEEIERICAQRGYSFHKQINYIARLMNQADFSLGTGGGAMWERCIVGLPSACTIVAHNQLESTMYAAQLGACINLGWHEEVTVDTYRSLLTTIKVDTLQQISKQGLNIINNEYPNEWLLEIIKLLRS